MAGTLPQSLSQVDPVLAWQRWEPSATDPWNLKWAGHLYRRAGFSAAWMELQEAVKGGPAATLNLVLDSQPDAAERDRLIEKACAAIAGKEDADALRGWWL